MTFIKDITLPCKKLRSDCLILVGGGVWLGAYTVLTVVFLERITHAIETGQQESIKIYLIYLAVLYASVLVNKVTFKILLFRFRYHLDNFLDKTYLKKYIRADNNAVERVGTGRLIAVYSKGVGARGDILAECFFGVAKLLTVFTISFIEIAKHGREFLLIAVAVIIAILAWLFFLRPYTVDRRKKAKNIEVERGRLRVKWFMSRNEILQQNKVDDEYYKKVLMRKEWFFYKKREKIRQGLAYDGGVLIANALIVVVTAYFAYGIFKGTNSYADFVLFTGLAILLRKEISEVLTTMRVLINSSIHVTKMRDVFHSLGTIKGYDEGKEFDYQKGDINIENISYGYDETAKLFNDFSLQIKGGKKTALVGESGSGKTTLVKIIAGYIAVQSGSVSIDGQPLPKESTLEKTNDDESVENEEKRGNRNISLKSYYKHIGYLTQEPSVFDGTIWENLTYAMPTQQDERKEEQLEKIKKIIHLSKCDFVREFPDGLETEIGERGIRLSGGQRQRLAIAKVFLKDPKIIILDEPTAALDSFSEEAITHAMHNLFKDRTVIIIAHRLQTVKEADDIVVLEKGKIVERGDHASLIIKDGIYAKMLELQSGF